MMGDVRNSFSTMSCIFVDLLCGVLKYILPSSRDIDLGSVDRESCCDRCIIGFSIRDLLALP
jgi:hypothetical protein